MAEHDDGASLQESYARLLSLAVHEFRTPASVVGGYLRMLQRDGDQPLSDRQRKMIDEAEKSCARLVGLITELSEISKLDGGTRAVQGPDRSTSSSSSGKWPLVCMRRTIARSSWRVRGETSGARLTADPMRIRAAFEAFFRAILREQPGHATVVGRLPRRTRTAPRSLSSHATPTYNGHTTRPAAPFDEKRGGLGLVVPIACRIVGALRRARLVAGNRGPVRRRPHGAVCAHHLVSPAAEQLH